MSTNGSYKFKPKKTRTTQAGRSSAWRPVARPLPEIWVQNSFWQIQIRWLVPPMVVIATFAARFFEHELPLAPLLAIAFSILLYNAVLAFFIEKCAKDIKIKRKRKRKILAYAEAIFDYIATILLIYYTGGTTSPLMYFFVFHIIFAAIQYDGRAAYIFAISAILAISGIVLLDFTGILLTPTFTHQGLETPKWDWHNQAAALLFFSITMLFIATTISFIMGKLRRRVQNLRTVTSGIKEANARLNSLYTIATSLNTKASHSLSEAMNFACAELIQVMQVDAAAVKLLNPEKTHLVFIGAYGLQLSAKEQPLLEVTQNPLDRGVLEAGFFVNTICDDDPNKPNPELSAHKIYSATSAPIIIEKVSVGVLTIYTEHANPVANPVADFLRIAASLIASAIQNSQYVSSIKNLIDERTKFMRQIAHNMRAPIGASLGLLELVREGAFGELNKEQNAYLNRIDLRLTGVNEAVGQLLALAHGQDPSAKQDLIKVDLREMLENLTFLFEGEFATKQQQFTSEISEEVTYLFSQGDSIHQVLENLLSNAIKYTPEKGKIELKITVEKDRLLIAIQDDGIGIPKKEQKKLFTPFFRASNAKTIDVVGTGLGLSLVKQTIEAHNGSLSLESELNKGTKVTISLPKDDSF